MGLHAAGGVAFLCKSPTHSSPISFCLITDSTHSAPACLPANAQLLQPAACRSRRRSSSTKKNSECAKNTVLDAAVAPRRTANIVPSLISRCPPSLVSYSKQRFQLRCDAIRRNSVALRPATKLTRSFLHQLSNGQQTVERVIKTSRR